MIAKLEMLLSTVSSEHVELEILMSTMSTNSIKIEMYLVHDSKILL